MGFGLLYKYNTGQSKKTPTLTVTASTTISVGGGTLTYDYDGDGAITATSSNTDVATVSVDTSTKTITITYVSAGSTTITVSAAETSKYSAVTATCEATCAKSTPTLTLSATSLTVAGGTGSNSFTYSYNGDGTVSASSSNTGIATVSVSGTKVTVTYVAAGSVTITVKATETASYSAISKTCSVTCSRTSVTIPSLSGTSFSTTGSAVGPTVKNFNSSLCNQSGTTSTATIGSYTITWSLKNSTKYCWSDNTTGNKTATWKCTAGTITFYIRMAYQNWASSQYSFYEQATFNATYGQTWLDLAKVSLVSVSYKLLASYSGSYATNLTIATNTKQTTIFSRMSSLGSMQIYTTAGSEITSGVWVGPLNLSGIVTTTDKPVNGKIYYAATIKKT